MALAKTTTAYAAPIGDRNDCSVRALSVAANLPYAECSALFTRHGRKPSRGTHTHITGAVHDELGLLNLNLQRIPTLTQFLKAHPTGRYVLHRNGHAFAVVDGVVHDWFRGTGPRSRIVYAAKVPTQD